MALPRMITLGATLLLLTGCVTAQEYSTSREVLAGSPAIRDAFVRQCIGRTASYSAANKLALAKVMSVPVSRAGRVYCQRMTQGIASGRISHADFNAAVRGNIRPSVIRVLQGR